MKTQCMDPEIFKEKHCKVRGTNNIEIDVHYQHPDYRLVEYSYTKAGDIWLVRIAELRSRRKKLKNVSFIMRWDSSAKALKCCLYL